VLLIIAYVLIRVSIPADPADGGAWLEERASTVALALSLVPIAGIAFPWFIGVVRDRLGQLEDRFFSSVFFGSGLLLQPVGDVDFSCLGAGHQRLHSGLESAQPRLGHRGRPVHCDRVERLGATHHSTVAVGMMAHQGR